MLPKGVEKVTARGHTYYYWHPDRGIAGGGKRVRLPDAETEPAAFWKEIELYRPKAPTPEGSVSFLVQKYRASEDFKRLSESTKASYGVHLNRFEAAWGKLSFDLPDGVVIALRDALAETAGMANHMLSVGRTLWTWGRSIGVQSNPFSYVANLDVADTGHVPWPAWAIELVCKSAWPDLVRMVRLALATCQRESDLIRMGPAQRERQGLWCRPQKTKKKRKAFYIPLTPADLRMLDRWPSTQIAFTATRWKAPIQRGNPEYYLFSPRGVPYTETSLRARWHRWLRTERGEEVCRHWQAWLAEMVRKYDWEIDPTEASYPTIDGLRGTGILIRRSAGHDVDQIANDIGMSRQMVERYMRFRDQMEVAATGQARLKVIKR
jgi:integrase